MSGKRICCTHCDSVEFIKKGTTSKKDGRIFLCKKCGKRFTYPFSELRGTAYAATGDEVNSTSTTTKTSTPAVTKKDNSNHTTTNQRSDCQEDRSTTGGFNMERAKRDKNGNLLLRVGVNGIPSPVGASYEDLMNIVNSNQNCTLSLGNDGIFVLTIATTTKGVSF